MSGGIRLGRLFGIEITVRLSWFIIMIVLSWFLATGVLPAIFPGSLATYWLVAAAAALLLFVSVLLHELAHSLVARAQGVPVTGITLFFFGGASNLEEDPGSPGSEATD